MSSILLTGSVWGRIRKLSESAPSALVAAPYFGTGATTLVNLPPHSILVVKFDRETVGAGQVDPREIVKAIKKGVVVHACANLHAKVFIFGNTAVIGSSNVSRNSDRHLLEACVETTEKQVVANAKRFVRSLMGDKVGLEYAEGMIPFYRPPARDAKMPTRAKRRKKIPSHSGLWFVALVEGSWSDIDYEQEERGRPMAEKAMENRQASVLETFQWSGKTLARYTIGQRVIQCTKTDDGRVLVSPPSRIVRIQKYDVDGKERAIVYLEAPKKYRRRRLESFLRSLGANATKLGNPRRTKEIRDPELIYKLGRLWS